MFIAASDVIIGSFEIVLSADVPSFNQFNQVRESKDIFSVKLIILECVPNKYQILFPFPLMAL